MHEIIPLSYSRKSFAGNYLPCNSNENTEFWSKASLNNYDKIQKSHDAFVS